MPVRPPSFRPGGPRTRREVNRQVDKERGSAAARGYDWAWAKESKAHREANPLCLYCALDERITACTLVDHLYPHRGDRDLFWDRTYWVSCCAPCHNVFKQSIEHAGRPALDALAIRLGLPPLGAGGGGQKSGAPSFLTGGQ